jgi:hypothetical protein
MIHNFARQQLKTDNISAFTGWLEFLNTCINMHIYKVGQRIGQSRRKVPTFPEKGAYFFVKNQLSDNKRGEKRKNRCKSGDLDGNCGMMSTVDCNLSTV